MTTEILIIDLFCRVDDQTQDLAKHPQAKLYPSEVITLALLFAIKGVGNRAYVVFLGKTYLPLEESVASGLRLTPCRNDDCRELTISNQKSETQTRATDQKYKHRLPAIPEPNNRPHRAKEL